MIKQRNMGYSPCLGHELTDQVRTSKEWMDGPIDDFV